MTASVDLLKIYNKNYSEWAEDPTSWLFAGHENFEIAKFLLNKYNSAHKRQQLRTEQSLWRSGTKKFRINNADLVLSRHVLMFFGLALECYLKGYLIKIGVINPIEIDKDGVPKLSSEVKSHKLESHIRSITRLSNEEAEALKNLERAVESGKYLVEARPNHEAYTANFNRDISTAKKFIKNFSELILAK